MMILFSLAGLWIVTVVVLLSLLCSYQVLLLVGNFLIHNRHPSVLEDAASLRRQIEGTAAFARGCRARKLCPPASPTLYLLLFLNCPLSSALVPPAPSAPCPLPLPLPLLLPAHFSPCPFPCSSAPCLFSPATAHLPPAQFASLPLRRSAPWPCFVSCHATRPDWHISKCRKVEFDIVMSYSFSL